MKTQYLCLILLILSPIIIQTAASKEPNYPHLVRLVASEIIHTDQTAETIPIKQHEITIIVNDQTSTAKTDDVGELPIFLGNKTQMYYKIIYKDRTITGSINQNDFYLRKHPVSNETMYYYSEAINFHTNKEWNPINPLTYDLSNTTHLLILAIATGMISLTITMSVLYIKYKIKKP
ncbi:hypothetical protein ACFL96_12765 [Thermoproteota archaeon]